MQLRFIHIRQCRGNAQTNCSYPNKCLSENSYVFLLYLLVAEVGFLKKKLYTVHSVYLLPSCDLHSLSIGDQKFAMQEDPSKRKSSYPASSASSCMRDESQLQIAKIPTNPIHRWSPSLPDSRCKLKPLHLIEFTFYPFFFCGKLHFIWMALKQIV